MPARKGPWEFDKCPGLSPLLAGGARVVRPVGGGRPREVRSRTVAEGHPQSDCHGRRSRAKGLICHLVQNDPSNTRQMPRLTDACRTMLVSRPGARNHLALA